LLSHTVRRDGIWSIFGRPLVAIESRLASPLSWIDYLPVRSGLAIGAGECACHDVPPPAFAF
jgi:hypothetical protein